MDFMGMKFVGEMLRMSGAFFIRSGRSEETNYTGPSSQNTSRMLKDQKPNLPIFDSKLGLLNIVMDPYFKGEVFDMSLVPVSISYERILEEALYAREMLGGLFKARKVLSEDYGSIHVYFGQPVSVRSLAEGRVNRCQFNLIPRHIPKRPSEEIQTFVNDSAYRLVRAQEENMVLKPWVLLVSLLLQNHHHQNQNQSQALGKNQGYHVPPSEVVSSSLSLHRGLVKISEGRVQLALDQAAGGGQTEPHSSAATPMPEEELLNRAVVVLSCASYRNQVLHIFLRPALLASAVHAASSTRNEVFNSFSFLRNMFSNEFILCPGATVQKTGALQVSQQEVLVTERGHRTLSFLTNMLDPFLQGYQLFMCGYPGRLRYSEVLSSDLQKNSLAALLRLGAVRKTKGAGTLKVDKVTVNSLEDTLGKNRAGLTAVRPPRCSAEENSRLRRLSLLASEGASDEFEPFFFSLYLRRRLSSSPRGTLRPFANRTDKQHFYFGESKEHVISQSRKHRATDNLLMEVGLGGGSMRQSVVKITIK
ncbi:hypothetical protein INR49_005251 [Caranx melampygus]|nr:hypothetical protein INR49_005251 [Caranx melampygus]